MIMITMNYIRSVVSENRKRYIDKDVNLDLSYITNNIIAMSYPSGGFESFYRNPYPKVKNFLDSRHAGHYKVYNLRREKQYDLNRFENAANYPFEDHQAPPFDTLIEFCQDASEWLQNNENNVVAIHCKAGKGRTGTVIAALLLNLGMADNADTAMEIYGKERTDNSKGVTIPSQRRYVEYYHYMLRNRSLYEGNKDKSVQLKQIMIHAIPHSMKDQFKCQIFDSKEVCTYNETSNNMDVDYSVDTMTINNITNDLLNSDFQIVFSSDKGKTLFSFWLNPVFIHIMNKDIIQLKKKDVDIAFKDKSCKEFDHQFAIDLSF
ncbi:protein-tyrosine phosphatase-like protein [Thamnidium elegans]|nr:protein-tyrosine phosphatase-like protein [Thamnidium elegans]